MNILILINSLSHGGAETMCYRIAEALAVSGNMVTLATTGKYEKNIQDEIYRQLSDKGIKVLIADRSKGRLNFIFSLVKYMRKNKIQLIHTNCKSPNYYGRIAALFVPKIKVVTTIHNMSQTGNRRKDERVFKYTTSQYVAVSDKVSDFCVESMGIKKNSIIVIPNGIIINKSFDNSVACKQRSQNKEFIILSVGRVLKDKNYLGMARCISKLMDAHENVKWVIVGGYSYDGDYLANLKSIMKDHIERVELVGETNNMESYYSQANCFFTLAPREGFGLAIVEATYYGLPVITSDVGIVSRLVDLGCSIHISTEDDAIEQLENLYYSYDNHQCAFDYNKNSSIIKANFSNENMCEQYIGLYIKLVQ